jgi:hypothetical protein
MRYYHSPLWLALILLLLVSGVIYLKRPVEPDLGKSRGQAREMTADSKKRLEVRESEPLTHRESRFSRRFAQGAPGRATMLVSKVDPSHSMPMTAEWVRALAAGPEEMSFALPDGRVASGVVEQRYVDADGNASGVEGRLLKPGAGRFRFRLQPPCDLEGPVTGSVVIHGDAHGYRVVAKRGGGSQLARFAAGQVICLMPARMGAWNGEMADEMAGEKEATVLPLAADDVPVLESLPGAVAVVYLDFDGEAGSHEGWGDFVAEAPALTASEIRGIWARVAEDFAPFDLNVTTSLEVYRNAAENSRQRCIITETDTAAPGSGGVAYLGTFNSAGDTPCWSFHTKGKSAAEVISHEVGHALKLAHHGRDEPVEEYYGGHGSGPTGWAPIMGVGYYRNLSQWSRGEYGQANRMQDDLAVISTQNHGVSIRGDDFGNTRMTASVPLVAQNGWVEIEGMIETPEDVDVFEFKVGGGLLSLTILPDADGPNLDVSASLRDEDGRRIFASNPHRSLHSILNVDLKPGTYTLHVQGAGRGDPLKTGYTDYGSLGKYKITGLIDGATDRVAWSSMPKETGE